MIYYILDMHIDEKFEQLKNSISKYNNIVFLGGAGVSTESGIPDFRSPKGLFKKPYDYGYPAEVILSNSFFKSHTEEFYNYYKAEMIYPFAKPNKAHLALAKLEKQGKLKGIITQNIDGLHQAAGSKAVYELHGTILNNICTSCSSTFPLSYIINSEGIPKCPECQGILKPDVVLYEEGLNEELLYSAAKLISDADMLIIGGTSLTVYPAAGLYKFYRGKCLAIINKSTTSIDTIADIVIRDNIGNVLEYAIQ